MRHTGPAPGCRSHEGSDASRVGAGAVGPWPLMSATSDLIDACEAVGELAAELGIGLLNAEDARLDGRTVRIDGRRLLQFASCSTLGLELDPRLAEGAIDAIRRFGTQFSASRAFLSAPPYAPLEEALGTLTGGPTIVTPSTTLASASALPSLVSERDVVLLDHQVHATVQLVMPLLQRMGVRVELVRHGRLDRLESRIRELRDHHPRVWYLLDGVYSMHGDLAPMDGLAWLLSRYEALHLFVDDAHGMSWTGLHGRGHALAHLPDRDRVVVALSLNKSFGAGGGALVFADEATRLRVRRTAGPLLFSGPLQPPMLGAALASARIHLSDELPILQGELLERIRHTNARARELDLPLVHPSEIVPIRFVGLGPRLASTTMAAHLRERGLLPSCALFPAVPAHQTGIRLTLTRHHTLEDIDRLLEEMAAFLPRALEAGGVTRPEVDRAFALAPAGARSAAGAVQASDLRCEHHLSIDELDAEEWDRLLGGRGSFDAGALRTLEEIFAAHQKPEHRWRFHYLRVRDGSDRTLAATVFVEAWMKDDMFSDAAVSRDLEERRRNEPFFLTSRVLMMGTPLTEGDALYLDRGGAWREALQLLLARVSDLAERADLQLVALRDLPADDAELERWLVELGHVRLTPPETLVVERTWRTREEYLARLTPRARRFQRQEVEPHDESFAVRVLEAGEVELGAGEAAHLHALYCNVQRRSFHVNTFPLPEDFLPTLLRHPGWEIVTLTRKSDAGTEPLGRPDAFFAARRTRDAYAPLVVGLDYRVVREHGAYRQSLAWMLRRAEALGLPRVLLGMGAATEKKRFGAEPVGRSVWVQARDHFHADVLALLAGGPRGRGQA